MLKNTNLPRPEYPRPDFERSTWLNLNGEWDFEYDDENTGERDCWYRDKDFSKKITVPFCYQSKLSSIDDKSFHDFVWYKRNFNILNEFMNKKTILNFGAVDYYAKVWINGLYVGEHKGGYTPFKFDITNFIKNDTNTIVVRVEDKSTDTAQPRGKQAWKKENFGCWYTRTTGIWQTVWLEAVPHTYFERVKITPQFDSNSVKIEAYINGDIDDYLMSANISINNTEIACITNKVTKNVFSFTVDISSDIFEWKILHWAPAHPNLYDVRFELVKDGEVGDSVKSYFGMRKISTKNGKVLLNNQPIYQKLVLDQGYFDGGLLTASSDEDFINDINLIKKLGFNGVRKHQKVEDPRFLYWSDKLGILVWGEMGSPYEFNDNMITSNINEWQQAVIRDYNHPCIIVWTLMNESWGIPNVLVNRKQQHHASSLYFTVKSLDDTRLLISNDGWEHTFSDIATFHDYTQDSEMLYKKLVSKERVLQDAICSIGDLLGSKYLFVEGYKYSGQPIVLSECCGVAYDTGTGWGYGKNVTTEEQFLERYKGILEAISKIDYISGFCCTQLTDVEQEINGLLTVDRRPKVSVDKFAEILNSI